MNALLSIKPKYVEAIVTGKKRYEFRKSLFKNTNLEKVYIYSTAPAKKVVGSFKIGKIVEDRPQRLWLQFKEFSGLNASEFFDYFGNAARGFAIEIKDVQRFRNPVALQEPMLNCVPPQSFCYLATTIIA